MPRGDRTGPSGMGPMTGRGLGYCTGYAVPGAGAGFCMGRGRGYRRMYHMTGMPGWARGGAYPYGFVPNAGFGKAPDFNEKEFLEDQADDLEKQLEGVRERLKGFENKE